MAEDAFTWLQRLLFLASVWAGWEIVCRYGPWPDYLLPAPSHVLLALWEGLKAGTVGAAAAVSLKRAALAFGAALVLGVGAGFLLVESPGFGALFRPIVSGLQSLPSICWFPLALLWLGLSERSVYAVTVLGALFSIVTSVAVGLRQVPPIYTQAAETMGIKGFDRYRWVLFPALLPTLVSGARQGWAFAWRSLMAAELLFHNGGVGYLLMRARELNDVAGVMAVIFVVLVLGALVERLFFERIDGHVRRLWGLERSRA